MTRIFSRLCGIAGRRNGYVGSIYPEDLSGHLQQKGYNAVIFANARYSKTGDLADNFRGVHMIRDPRDIIVSGYYSHRYSHSTDGWPDMRKQREKLKACSVEEGLLLDMDFFPTNNALTEMRRWNYQDPRILELKFEEFTKDYLGSVVRIANHLFQRDIMQETTTPIENLKLDLNRRIHDLRLINRLRPQVDTVHYSDCKKLSDQFSFAKMTGRKKGQEDKKSHNRNGSSGQWRDVFTNVHREKFREKFGDVLQRTGYCLDESW
jgi:hypothetical protein